MTPLTFVPHFRPQVWGGRRLESVLGKSLPAEGRYGEAWDLSSQKLHVSRVAAGPHEGRTLNELWMEFGSQWFPGAPHAPDFPLLVKWLDCDELLSVQVHPSDESAQRLINEARGKSEAWVILHAEPTALVYAGLKAAVSREELETRMRDGSVAQCLHEFTPRRGDVIFIPAGTVHAAGGGIVMAEVQQTSDATFRMFDWNRPGPDGRPRQLHIEQALECVDWTRGPVEPIARIDLNSPAATSVRTVLDCPYFRFDIVQVADRPQTLDAPLASIVMALSGDVQIADMALKSGTTALLPPSSSGWSLAPATSRGATALWVHPRV
jgi:mannose-6-phosphate isomerase